jgi:hypothetical protein
MTAQTSQLRRRLPPPLFRPSLLRRGRSTVAMPWSAKVKDRVATDRVSSLLTVLGQACCRLQPRLLSETGISVETKVLIGSEHTPVRSAGAALVSRMSAPALLPLTVWSRSWPFQPRALSEALRNRIYPRQSVMQDQNPRAQRGLALVGSSC